MSPVGDKNVSNCKQDSIAHIHPGFIRIREMSGKLKIFQGQGIVREFHNLSGKIEFLLKCRGILEFQMKFRFSNKKKKEEKF